MMLRSNRIRALLIAFAAVVLAVEPIPAHAEDSGKMLAVNPQTLKFIPIPDLPSCASGAVLRGNPRSGPAWVLLKLASGCRVPAHWHTANEDLLIVSGQGTLAMKDGVALRFAPGAYASLPSHHVHEAICSRTCLLFSIADGAFDIHYVDANGAELTTDQALKPAKGKSRKK